MLSVMTIVTASHASQPPAPVWIFPIFFVGVWLLVALFISRVGGWSTLAEYYRADQPFFGTLFRFQAASFRAGSNYNGCLNFGANGEGLYLRPMLLFRAFHPPLFIPWSEVSAQPIKLWLFFNFVELRFHRSPAIPVRIKPALANKLLQASAGRFRADLFRAVGI
jgi:hypothetical protein